jgi:hypothetical protein
MGREGRHIDPVEYAELESRLTALGAQVRRQATPPTSRMVRRVPG